MPFKTEYDGKEITAYTQEDLDKEVAGLKVTNSQLKDEKTELKAKLSESESAKLAAEEASATVTGDKEALQRISDEREAKSRTELDALKNSIRSEKSDNMLNSIVNELGAGGVMNEDLRDILKVRFSIDYDMDKHEHTFSGDNVTNMDELKKVITDSGRYDAYLAGSGSTGGDSLGSKGAGATTKKFTEYTGAELKAIKDNNPADYDKLKAAHALTL